MQLIQPEDTRLVVDKSKIWRARVKSRKKLSDVRLDGINALYFDGRKDKTLTQQHINGTTFHKTVVEEHITLLQEPSSQYIGHTVPQSGTSIHIAESICEFFNSRSSTIDQSTFAAVGCDGTNGNVGHKGGVIRLLELTINRPVQ